MQKPISLPVKHFRKGAHSKPITSASPITRRVVELVHELGFTYAEVARRAGIHFKTFNNWRYGKRHGATLSGLEAVLQVMGYKLMIVKITDEEDLK